MTDVEHRLFIPVGHGRLEAVMWEKDPHKAGVVCHPHPLYGGSMQNNVVYAGVQALVESGWTSLRFNFRGVGQSTGSFDEGRGEQDDLADAIQACWARGDTRVVAIGYSFGAWVASFAWKKIKGPGVEPLILVAPPASFMSFDGLDPDTEIGLMICGEHDEIGPPDLAREFGAKLASPVEPVVVKGADHFFSGYEPVLTDLLAEYLQSSTG
jgi:alpha/beta superfamily hydrolase